MKISTSELKRFKNNSSFIRHNNILPILSYLKFDNGKVTKTSLSNFIVQDIEFKGSFLVDENILFNFLNFTSEPTIDISVKGKRVVITDGKSTVECPSEDMVNFPSVAEPEGKWVELPTDIFQSISYAANFIEVLEIQDMRSHVFVGDKIVGGSNGIIGYVKEFDEELPKIVLPKDTAVVIGKLNQGMFGENEKYIFIDTLTTRYGFIKPSYPYMNIGKLGKYNKESKNFTIDKNELLSFSEMCTSSTKAKGINACFVIAGGKLKMSMVDTDFEVNVNKAIDVSGEMDEIFNFNPGMMSTLLKNIPDTDITLYENNESYSITGESQSVSIIQGLVQL